MSLWDRFKAAFGFADEAPLDARLGDGVELERLYEVPGCPEGGLHVVPPENVSEREVLGQRLGTCKGCGRLVGVDGDEVVM